jgi:hypothetical protein
MGNFSAVELAQVFRALDDYDRIRQLGRAFR